MRLGDIISRLSPTALAKFGRNTVIYTIRGEDYIDESYFPNSPNETITWNGINLATFKAAQFYYHKTVPT